jgi:hypothetical protein
MTDFRELIIDREAFHPRERDTDDYARFRIALKGTIEMAWTLDWSLESVEQVARAVRETLADARDGAEFVHRNRDWRLKFWRADDNLHVQWHIAEEQVRSEAELRLPVHSAGRFVKRFLNQLREKPDETVSASVLLVTPSSA